MFKVCMCLAPLQRTTKEPTMKLVGIPPGASKQPASMINEFVPWSTVKFHGIHGCHLSYNGNPMAKSPWMDAQLYKPEMSQWYGAQAGWLTAVLIAFLWPNKTSSETIPNFTRNRCVSTMQEFGRVQHWVLLHLLTIKPVTNLSRHVENHLL